MKIKFTKYYNDLKNLEAHFAIYVQSINFVFSE